MKTCCKIITLLAALGLAFQAQADGLYDITFTDAGGANAGSGQIDVENGFALNGYFDVTAGIAAGNWTLYTTGGTAAYPGFLTSPTGSFNYDNSVYLTSNPQFPATNPFLDQYGLLFTDASGNEISLWGNADGTYTFDAFINNAFYPDPNGIVGVSTIAPAPEPANLAALAWLLVPAGAFLRRKLHSES